MARALPCVRMPTQTRAFSAQDAGSVLGNRRADRRRNSSPRPVCTRCAASARSTKAGSSRPLPWRRSCTRRALRPRRNDRRECSVVPPVALSVAPNGVRWRQPAPLALQMASNAGRSPPTARPGRRGPPTTSAYIPPGRRRSAKSSARSVRRSRYSGRGSMRRSPIVPQRFTVPNRGEGELLDRERIRTVEWRTGVVETRHGTPEQETAEHRLVARERRECLHLLFHEAVQLVDRRKDPAARARKANGVAEPPCVGDGMLVPRVASRAIDPERSPLTRDRQVAARP